MNFCLRYIKGFNQGYPDYQVPKRLPTHFSCIVLHLSMGPREGCPKCTEGEAVLFIEFV